MFGLSLCSGIGGLELGLHRAMPGYRTVCHVERDAYAAATLVARMEEAALDPAPVWDSLETFDGTAWRGVVDIVSAGYPCQPFSVAGNRLGEKDPRHLWPEVLRIVREVRPGLVFLENVSGHLRLGFDRVLADLAEAGFDVEWTTVRASDAGAPHNRERLFVLAYRDGRRLQELRVQELGWESGSRGSESDGRDSVLGDACGEGLEGSGHAEQRRFPLAWPPGPGEAYAWGRILAEDPGLAPALERDLRRMADELPEGMVDRADRLRCLGNAVVPAQAELAFRELVR